MADYGNRVGGAGPKGSGWLGPLKRPDGKVSTEISVQYGDLIGGNPIPLLVPTLSQQEINYLLSNDPQKMEIPESIKRKAIDHAIMRDKQGLSPFKD